MNDENIDLRVQNPNPSMGGHFGLLLPMHLSEESFEAVKRQIEFRRKCMNQGFDNLLELLDIAKGVLVSVAKETEPKEV